jgi:very-short-patch-repair endonuclease
VAVSDLAARQHGVVSTAQLREIGLGGDAVLRRVRAGRLHRLYRGVYAVGHTALTREGRWLAAVLACGDGAALSHRSAAALWGFRPTDRARIEVTVPRSRSGPPGVEVHRTRRLQRGDARVHRAIRVTTPARTLADLADLLPPDALARAIHEAEVLRLLDVRAVREAHANGRRGAANLAAALVEPAPHTRSELEARFATFCRRERLPLPLLNASVRTGDQLYELDALWPQHRVVAELDGAAFHHTRRAFHRDRERDLALAADGYVVVRLTWRQVTQRPRDVAAKLRRLLASRAATP